MTLSNPASAASRAAAITPAAGPERTMLAARLPSCFSGTSPPLDCITSACVPKPRSASLACRLAA